MIADLLRSGCGSRRVLVKSRRSMSPSATASTLVADTVTRIVTMSCGFDDLVEGPVAIGNAITIGILAIQQGQAIHPFHQFDRGFLAALAP
ncbi:MAG: hypothetical protein U5R48_13270 [Gammaproteobacteria bacterium]|nr:hypothetical protein [Gammaproteobacteria bacterium]